MYNCAIFRDTKANPIEVLNKRKSTDMKDEISTKKNKAEKDITSQKKKSTLDEIMEVRLKHLTHPFTNL